MGNLKQTDSKISRQYIENDNLSTCVEPVTGAPLQEMGMVLDGVGRNLILQKMANRYATTLMITENDGNKQTVVKRTEKSAQAAITGGMLEVVSLYTYQRIIAELATLWNGESKYKYTGKGADIVAKDLSDDRSQSNSDLTMSRIDSLSVMAGSAVGLVSVIGGKYHYSPIKRQDINIAFGDYIAQADGTKRSTITTNLEDASTVVIRTGLNTSGKMTYTAWYARCDKYPNGRRVQFVSSDWYDIPDVNDERGNDFIHNGEIANPLTLQNNIDGVCPEYPIFPWYGYSHGYGEALLPVNPDLYYQTKEFDLAASRLLNSALKSARGVMFLAQTDQTGTEILNEIIDEGPVYGGLGQTLTNVTNPASNSLSAWDVLNNMIGATASAYGVPSYLVSIKDSISFPSGEALKVANQPLIERLSNRYRINKSNALRKFKIEIALASLESGKQISTDVTETWIPANRDLSMKNRLNEIQTAKAAVDAGFSTVNEEIKSLQNLDSLDEVEAWKAARGLKKVAKPQTGILARVKRG